eukprot:CAMPEP_0174938170 /NCGR_PEP_ID=MMETSP1355-20121228/62622_1 /TAXON_ID=464990 /ORGANISM="Hemiselmis tepida, Strain CCMP443" /LENGTH=118 /DNA_ID=CAMNT_0016185071 /DNA_START=38 /DNA_END=391 /DNA_ORIENTATION=+
MAVRRGHTVAPRHSGQDGENGWHWGRGLVAATAGVLLVAAAAAVAVGTTGGAGPRVMLSWSPAVENPMAAAALGNKAASTAETHFSLKKQDTAVLRAPAAPGWVAGRTRREARAIERK